MGEAAPEQQLSCIMDQEANGANADVPDGSLLPRWRTSFNWWLRLATYALLVISGQSAATLLGRIYFNKGGNSIWLSALVQLAGFPILLLYYCIPARTSNPTTKNTTVPFKPPSTLILAAVYVSLGLLVALYCVLYSVGQHYLPVSTYSIICASQLAFSALFSFFLNSQKFTPYIINSLVLLAISSTLLVFQDDSADDTSTTTTGSLKTKYAIGFICTIAASAGDGLALSLTQYAFQRVIKRETFAVMMDMIVYQSLVGTCALVVGLFGSGEWKGLRKEMEEFESGKVSYFMNLTWIAITWQLFSFGSTGLIMDASCLFSNAVSIFGSPVVPVLAVIFLHEKMDGIKAMSLVLAAWGFVSYAYQHYLDHKSETGDDRNVKDEVSKALPLENINGGVDRWSLL